MITHIKFKNGFATQLPHFHNRAFEFKPGFNILFGPNGCGKSTVLNTVKGYCSIEEGGWSAIVDPMKTGSRYTSDFPHCLTKFTPGNCAADVGWDGTPSLFNKGEIDLSTDWFFYKQGKMADGITTEDEHMKFLMDKPSTGQYRINRLNKIKDVITSPPAYSIPQRISDVSAAQAQISYIQGLNPTGVATLLLDEPERALSITMHQDLFVLLQEISQSCQVIVATHSPFCLGLQDANIIDIIPDYIAVSKTAVKQLATLL